jgi:hypothetical protein
MAEKHDDWTSAVHALSIFLPVWLSSRFSGNAEYVEAAIILIAALVGWLMNRATRRMFRLLLIPMAGGVVLTWIVLTLAQQSIVFHRLDRDVARAFYAISAGLGATYFAKCVARARELMDECTVREESLRR